MTIHLMDRVGIVVDDLDATVARIQALSAELVGEIAHYEGGQRLCHVRDPEGIIVELAEPIG
jgi:predicted enzyme related to lactoylglutathione lyase